MRDRKQRIEVFSTYDYTGIARHLTRMAKRGWMLDGIGGLTWKYSRCEPADVRFRVTYFPTASGFDPEIGEEQQTYIDYCRAAGWELCANSGQMQVFRAVREDAVEIETDGDIQLNTIHAAMKKAYLPSYAAMLVLGWMEFMLGWNSFQRDPVEYFLGMNILALSAVLMLMAGAELILYGLWLLRAKRALKNGDSLPKTVGSRPLQLVFLLFVLVEFAIWIFYQSMDGAVLITLCSVLLIAFMLAVTFLIRAVLKRKKVDAGLSKVITYTACVLLPVILIPTAGVVTFQVINAGVFSRAEIVEYDGSNIRVYHDELPLTVEDLTSLPEDGIYSRQLERKSSPYLWRMEGKQRNPVFEKRKLPDLEYTVMETGIRWLYDRILMDALYVDTTVFQYTWELIQTENGCMVYRMEHDGHYGNSWVLVTSDRVITLRYSDDLNEEQMSVVMEKLITHK